MLSGAHGLHGRGDLNDPVPNTGVTPARLRKELEDMAAVLKRTEPMWDTAR